MQSIKPIILALTAVLLACICPIKAQDYDPGPKREFRGAWMHTVHQSQYAEQTSDQNMRYICDQLDKMQAAGINAVFFQVRPSADAFYSSQYEPWSRFLCPDQLAPDPYWDPLEFIITEAHQRGMELHAWVNPYRVTTAPNQKLPKDHLYYKEPHRFVTYEGDGRIYFDPGLPENRVHIVNVITDIINRYNVDGIHFDDYFYPYPSKGKEFPDKKSYDMYGRKTNKADWRRRNVDKLIQAVHYAVRSSNKPWIRFGVSPFGIWRNNTSDPKGSKTNGLQNYDDLYSDVLLWAQEGWVDYLIPQLYWELEHKRASSQVLIDWWARSVDPKCHLYIGQDVERTMNARDLPPSTLPDQLAHKIELSRNTPGVMGNCWWPCYSVTSDYKGVAQALTENFQSTYALVPAYTGIESSGPERVSAIRLKGNQLSWNAAKIKGVINDPVKFVVYRFDSFDAVDIDDASAIVAVTPNPRYNVSEPGIYVITALDRVNNESKPSDGFEVI